MERYRTYAKWKGNRREGCGEECEKGGNHSSTQTDLSLSLSFSIMARLKKKSIMLLPFPSPRQPNKLQHTQLLMNCRQTHANVHTRRCTNHLSTQSPLSVCNGHQTNGINTVILVYNTRSPLNCSSLAIFFLTKKVHPHLSKMSNADTCILVSMWMVHTQMPTQRQSRQSEQDEAGFFFCYLQKCKSTICYKKTPLLLSLHLDISLQCVHEDLSLFSLQN